MAARAPWYAIRSALLSAPAFSESLGLTKSLLDRLQDRQIGYGYYASVYALPDDRVLKVTVDRPDAEAARVIAAHVARTGRPPRGLPHIYEVKQLKQLSSASRDTADELFAIVMEPLHEMYDDSARMVPSDDEARAILSWISKSSIVSLADIDRSLQLSIPGEAGVIFTGKFGEQKRDDFWDAILAKTHRPLLDDVISGVRWLRGRGFEVTDLHQGNFGVSDDERGVIFDFGHQRQAPTRKVKIAMAKNGVERLVHSPKPISDVYDVDEQSIGEKPEGLWYSCGAEWENWYGENTAWRKEHYKHLYAISVDMKRMCLIRTVDEFDTFTKKYGRVRVDGLDRISEIDWPRVAQDYDGIEICPYRKTRRLVDWYYPWDVASGCVWRARAVTSLKEVHVERNPKIVGFVANGPVHWKEVVHHLDSTDPSHFAGRSTIGADADLYSWTLEKRRVDELPRAHTSVKESVPKYAEMIRRGSAPPAIVIAEHPEHEGGGRYDPVGPRHRMGGEFEVWDGNHRLAAAARAGLEEVDVYVGRRIRRNPVPVSDVGIGSAGVNKHIDESGLRVLMKPSTFLSLAAPLPREAARSADWLRQQMRDGKPVAPPFLVIRIPDSWLPVDHTVSVARSRGSDVAEVVQHEGRNRMYAALEEFGDVPVEVLLWDPDLVRDEYEDEWIERLRSGMQREGGRGVLGGPLFDLPEPSMTPNRGTAPMDRVERAFNRYFSKTEQLFPDFGTIELHLDEKAASDNGAGSERQFGYCKDGEPITIAFAEKTNDLPAKYIDGLMAHEFGHAIEFRYGRKELEKKWGKLPESIERRADKIAERAFGKVIEYGDLDIQCIACGGKQTRPKRLG